MKRILAFLFLLLAIFKISYCEDIPLISTPFEIKNYVSFYDNDDFAIYKLYIFNPTNYSYSYSIVSLSVDWIIFYGKNDLDRFGTILPNQRKEIMIYLRPKKIKVQAPTFIISFRSNKEERIYTSTIILNPRINYELKNISSVKLEKIEIFPETLKAGDIFSIILKIYNPNSFDINIPITINTSYGYKKETIINLIPGNNTIKVENVIPSSLKLDNFTLEIKIDELTIEETLYLLTEEKKPKIEVKNNYIILSNLYEDYIYYEFELPYSKIDLFLFRFYPKPFEYIIRNNNIYARWKIVLLPKENYIIKKDLNYYSILVLLLLVSLFITFLILIARPKIEIKKEIIRFSPEEKIIRIAIYIKNKGVLPINNVIIRDRVPEMFKINKYDTVEPLGLYKEGEETILEWSYDKIKPKEELIISYTISIAKEISKTISIPNAVIQYSSLFGEKIENSNKISISLVE
ncbi:MAG: hypothetical protein QW038_00915 [Nanopusillaceae archaeon]